jgi:hypothetical protein
MMFQIGENELRSGITPGDLSPALFQSARSSVDPMMLLLPHPRVAARVRPNDWVFEAIKLEARSSHGRRIKIKIIL